MGHPAFLVLSFPEWAAWLEQRELRCLATRIRRIDTADGDAFKRLLDTAPFIDAKDEGAFVIAQLQSDFITVVEISDRFDGADVWRLPLRVATSFHAVTARAKLLLTTDAEKWRCRMEAPLNLHAWNEWSDEQAARLAHKRGVTVARFFGLSLLPRGQLDATSGATLVKARALQEGKRAEHEQCCSLGWAEAFAHCLARLGDDHLELVAENGPVAHLVRDRKKHYTLTDESFVTQAALAAADYAENMLQERSAPPLAVLATAAFHHFEFVFATGKPIDERLMYSLGNVLSAIRIRYDDELAGILAYEIGRMFPEAHVAALEKDLDRALYPALESNPLQFLASDLMRLPIGLDVRRREKTVPVVPGIAGTVADPVDRASPSVSQPDAVPSVEQLTTETSAVADSGVSDATKPVSAAAPKKGSRSNKKKAKKSAATDSTVTPADVAAAQTGSQSPLFMDEGEKPAVLS